MRLSYIFLATLLAGPAHAEMGLSPLVMGGLSPVNLPTGVHLNKLSLDLSAKGLHSDYVLGNDGPVDAEVALQFHVPRYFGLGETADGQAGDPVVEGGVPRGTKLVAHLSAAPVELPAPHCKSKACLAKHARKLAALRQKARQHADKRVSFKTEVRAVMCDEAPAGAATPSCRDVTGELKKSGLSDGQIAYYEGGAPPDNTLRKKPLPSLKQNQADDLAEAGLIDHLEDGEWPNLPGRWGVDVTYTWRVMVPAGGELKLTHEYQQLAPPKDEAGGYTGQWLAKEACANKAFLREWKRRTAGEPTWSDDYRFGEVTELAFDLSSLGGWGKLGQMDVRVTPGKGALLTTCLPGLERKGLTWHNTIHDVTPAGTLRFVLVHKPVETEPAAGQDSATSVQGYPVGMPVYPGAGPGTGSPVRASPLPPPRT